jgi:hypothetical protein
VLKETLLQRVAISLTKTMLFGRQTLTTARIPAQHYEFNEQRKTMKQELQQTQGSSVDRGDEDDSSQPGQGHDNDDDDDDTDAVQVGAFAISGVGGESTVDVSSLSGNTEARTVSTTQDSTAAAVPVLHARVVDDAENPSLSVAPIIEAKPMEETESAVTHLLKALLQNRKCQLVLTLTVALCIGGIIAAVLLTPNGSIAGTSNS